MDKYDVTPRSLTDLQTAIAEWGLRNFGPPVGPRAWQTTLGITEEVGELATALRTGDVDSVADAAGDALVYACAFCSHPDNRLDVADCLEKGRRASKHELVPDVLRTVGYAGKLSHCVLKRAQGIRGFADEIKYRSTVASALSLLLAHLDKIVQHYVGHTLEQVVTVVAEEVLRRDWVAHKETGT